MDCRIPEGPCSVAIVTTYLGVCNAPIIMLFILSFPDGNKLPTRIRHWVQALFLYSQRD